jgi:hypothetical protein
MSAMVGIKRQEWLKTARPFPHISIPQQIYPWNPDNKVWKVIMNSRKCLKLIA